MQALYAILSFLITAGSLFAFRVIERKSKLDSESLDVPDMPATQEEKKEWDSLSWNGTNPRQVIYLAFKTAISMDEYNAAMHLTSSFYSQVKHLVKKGRIPTAIAFFMKSREFTKKALQERTKLSPEHRNPIDLEILGAPDFLLSKIPVFGTGFGWKANAIDFLEEADQELGEKPDPLMASIIWSKLWSLTGSPTYRERVRRAGLNPSMIDNQLGRVAKHMGFKDTKELLEFCGQNLQ